MNDRVRRGIICAVVFGVFGFVEGSMFLLGVFPFSLGYFVVRLFMSDMAIGHGGAIFIPFADAVCFGVVGFVMGWPSKTQRARVFWGAAVLVGILVVAAACYVIFSEKPADNYETVAERLAGMERMLVTDPNNVDCLHDIGVYYFTKDRDFAKAETYFRRCVDVESKGGTYSLEGQRSLLYLALILQAKGDHKQAESFHERFLATNPDLQNDFVLLNYNQDYKRQNQTEKK